MMKIKQFVIVINIFAFHHNLFSVSCPSFMGRTCFLVRAKEALLTSIYMFYLEHSDILYKLIGHYDSKILVNISAFSNMHLLLSNGRKWEKTFNNFNYRHHSHISSFC